MKRLLITVLAAILGLTASANGISTAVELVAFAEAANSGSDLSPWLEPSGEVLLKADIDMSKIKRFPQIANFEGIFDGQGHTIRNWKAEGGLFRLIAIGSVVRRLIIGESCSMRVADNDTEPLYAGFIADINHGTLERCENYGTIVHRSARSAEDNYVGGVCGMNKFIVIRCKNGGAISSSGSPSALADSSTPLIYLGGVLGGSLPRSLPGAYVAYCENTGKVSYSGAFPMVQVGGIVGYNQRVKVKFCINRGAISSSARGMLDANRKVVEMVGGICGIAKGDVVCCDNFGTVTTASDAYSVTAGICGTAHESMTVGDCVNYAAVSSKSTLHAAIGGIVGQSARPVAVIRCRNKGALRFDGVSIGLRTSVGGIVGEATIKQNAIYAASVRNCLNEGDVYCAEGQNVRNSAFGMHAAGIIGFLNGNANINANVMDCENTGTIRSESGRTAGICGFSGFGNFDGCLNNGTVEGEGALLGGIVAGYDDGYLHSCTNRGDISAGANGLAGGIAATTWNSGTARIEKCRNSGLVRGRFGMTATILAEGRSENNRIEGCGIGGAVGTPSQSHEAASRITADNFTQFITGRNVIKNKASIDRESCYYWDGNN